MSSPVIRTLYAALYRLAISFDRQRGSKALIYRHSISDPQSYKTTSTMYYSTIINQLLGPISLFYSQSRLDVSFRAILREEFHKTTPDIPTADRITSGFAILRKFSTLWAQYESSTGRPRKRIPKEQKFNIQLTNELKSGVMLCAHPLLPGYMQRAVVLILEHSDKGSYGIIINKKTDHTVETSTLNLPPELLRVFQNNIVFFGGSIPRCQILHPFQECGGQLVPGSSTPLYSFSNASIKKAIEIASDDPNLAKKFQFFIGCCVWKSGTLETEINAGTWIAVSGEVDQLLSHAYHEPIPETYAVYKRSKSNLDEDHIKIINDTPEKVEKPQKDIYEGPNETWSRALWSLSRQANHFGHLDPNLDTTVVDSIDWNYSEEMEDEDDDDDDDEDESE